MRDWATCLFWRGAFWAEGTTSAKALWQLRAGLDGGTTGHCGQTEASVGDTEGDEAKTGARSHAAGEAFEKT